jgi:hypothetical protein
MMCKEQQIFNTQNTGNAGYAPGGSQNLKYHSFQQSTTPKAVHITFAVCCNIGILPVKAHQYDSYDSKTIV